MCAPLPRSLANAGGCPKDGLDNWFGPSLNEDQDVTAVEFQGSSAVSPGPVFSVAFRRV